MDKLNTNLLKLAKIDEANIKKTVQILNFGDANETSSVKLIELDNELMETLQQDYKFVQNQYFSFACVSIKNKNNEFVNSLQYIFSWRPNRRIFPLQ